MPRRTDISSILIIGAGPAPSPRRGEGWGEGVLSWRIGADAVPTHHALSPRGRGFKGKEGLIGAISGDEKLLADGFEHAMGVGEHIVVPEAEDDISVSLDDRRSGGVTLGTMLAAVQFDRQPGRAAGEVGNIIVDLKLTDELLVFEPPASEVMPEALFGVGPVGAKPAGDRRQALLSQLSSPSPNSLPAGKTTSGCLVRA
jgi:hypothetical protein